MTDESTNEMTAPPRIIASADAPLVRAIDTRALAFNAVNMTIGTTVYVVPALIALEVGSAGVLAFLACAGLMALIVLSFAEAGSRVSRSGGMYAWAEVAFGPFVAFVLGWVFYLGAQVVGAASVMTLMLGALGQLAPALGSSVARVVIVAALLGGVAAINIRGVKRSSRAVEAVTTVKLVPLVLVLGASVAAVNVHNLSIDTLPSPAAFGRAVVLAIFLFSGIETALSASGEVSNPSRSVPRAVMLALAVVTILYVGTQVMAQGVMGPELVQFRDAPISEMASRRLGGLGRGLVLSAMIVAPMAFVLGEALASPRLVYAMSCDGFLPRWVSRVHPDYHTPYAAILVHTVLIGIATLTRSFRWLVLVSSVAILLVYLVCCLATIQLRRRNVRSFGAPFELPFGVTIPAVASVVVLALLAATRKEELLAVGALLGVGVIVYWGRRRRRPGA
jgi:basic amino acid/polyamine antiporter, APA family